jgi:hypothetical protein
VTLAYAVVQPTPHLWFAKILADCRIHNIQQYFPSLIWYNSGPCSICFFSGSEIVIWLLAEIVRVGRVAFQSHASLVAENLFLRKELAFYRERKIKPHRVRDAARLALVFWSRWFGWRNALVGRV